MRRLGPLGTRLVLAFSAVTLVTVTLLVAASQVAVQRGLDAVRADGLWSVAEDAAAAAGTAYGRAGGWDGADLTPVETLAADAYASVEVTDSGGTVVLASSGGHGQGVSAPVVAGDRRVGTVVARSTGQPGAGAARAEARGRQLAWSWIVGAAAVALLLAVVAGWAVTRWLTRPLADLAAVARAFAHGHRGARARPSGAGEIADLAHGFNDAADAVERSAAARRQMAADVAHELRTPLGALQASLEELRDGLVPADPQALARLHDQSVRLGRVVADLGVLAESERAPAGVTVGRTDLAALVREEAAAREPELRSAGVTVRRADLDQVWVLADPDRVHQVVGNLLANCARHCRPGDHVDLTVRADGDTGTLVVADDGPGIAAENLPRVFDRYWRDTGPGVPGSGLGLAVVREIVEAHGGAVTVASHGGTAVTVRLPRVPH